MTINTERCYLRQLTVDDASLLFSLNGDPEVIEFTADIPFKSIEEAQEFITNECLKDQQVFQRLIVCLKDGDVPIGWCGFQEQDNFVDLGFRFLKTHWGRGYASETTLATVEYGFKQLNLDQIVARVAEENVASIGVIEKLGLEFWKADLCHHHQAKFYRISKDQFFQNSKDQGI